jgi:cyclohexadienyl dehydratase
MRVGRRLQLVFCWLALALAALTASLAQAQTVSHLDQAVQRGVLRVGTTGDYKPFSFLNPARSE